MSRPLEVIQKQVGEFVQKDYSDAPDKVMAQEAITMGLLNIGIINAMIRILKVDISEVVELMEDNFIQGGTIPAEYIEEDPWAEVKNILRSFTAEDFERVV